MNTREAATQLSLMLDRDVTPKALRRHLRSNERWTPAGMGSTYTLNKNNLRSIAKEMRETAATRKPRTLHDPHPELDQDKGVTVEDILKAQHDPTLRNNIQERRRQRQERLTARMREVGVGIR